MDPKVTFLHGSRYLNSAKRIVIYRKSYRFKLDRWL